MKDSETLIEKLAHRRNDPSFTPSHAAPEVQAPTQREVPLTVLTPEPTVTEEFEHEPEVRSSWRSWVLVLGVMCIGLWMFTAAVGPKTGAKALSSSGVVLPETKSGVVAAPVARPAAVSVPMSDSAPAADSTSVSLPAVVPLASPPSAQRKEIPAATTRAPQVRQKERVSAPPKSTAWRETTSPLPAYDEANDGSIDRSSKPSSGAPSVRLPNGASAQERLGADKKVSACSTQHGLALTQCQRCEGASMLARPFCREQARLEYCQGRYGKSAECPLVGYANGF